MAALIVRRLFQLVPLLLGVTFVVFISLHLAPGDPASIIGGPTATAEDVESIRQKLGLDDPLFTQYFRYLGDLFQGDLGYSYQSNQSVAEAIMLRFPNTFNLSVASMIVATLIGVGAGILSAIRQNSAVDTLSTIGALAGVSIPNFWLGSMLILIFSVYWQWFPAAGFTQPPWTWAGLRELILPAITLGTGSAALIARMTRSAVLEVIRQDYIRTARAKGVKEKSVILVHCMRNAMIPVITVIGLNFGFLLGGTIITEQVFAINGVGRLMVQAIAARDYPMVQGSVLLVATLFILVNLIVDILYAWIDPRIRYE
ncbi:peptide/nickel transport system permease protein [Melghirimyces thermohalophilus]|uniref:Nickel import system permease protein NikB n=1 Tax=Melghirimyces thermohalophilus TaxID=1236220 RepID=A0A1G6IVR4_9BACL|nr:nickel ABC transporter permease [Melghirimyces thermohalophilus]SDC09856.1 peptide/nickel transport system permease protein [Melghirimyces thermohalophilus]